jgi:hypothetical protein
MINPEWIGAAAEVAAAVEGVAVFGKKQEAAAAPAAVPGYATTTSLTPTIFLVGVAILAMAMLGAAVIIHHGLTV